MCRVGSREHESVLPHELDELFLELASERDDRVKVIGPYDHHTLIALHGGERNQGGKGSGTLTMNAPHCSLSALGSMLIVSTI